MTSRGFFVRLVCILLLTLSSVQAFGAGGAGDKRSFSVHWQVVDNGLEAACCQSELVLTNTGSETLAASGWSLYFNFQYGMETASAAEPVLLKHVNGDLFRLEPTGAFVPLRPGQSIKLALRVSDAVINNALSPAGFYFVFNDAEPEPVASVTVGPFVEAKQLMRGKEDLLPTASAETRYAANRGLTLLDAGKAGKILPTPAHLERRDGATQISAQTMIVASPQLGREAGLLADELEPLLGARLRIFTAGTAGVAGGNTIRLALGEAGTEESYKLEVAAGGDIAIKASTAAGIFYGIQSLRGLIGPEYYRSVHAAVPVEAVVVEDAPRFGHRGVTLDVARNFQPKEAILKLLDAMAFYKLNKLQLHMADDEGWRLEIDGLPELTAVGGRRGYTTDESDRLEPSYGSGPTPYAAGTHGSGFYSRADFIEILRHADRLHIEVIPEIESPGHARAAIHAMRARSERLKKEGKSEEARTNLLSDPGDTSKYESSQGWKDNVIDVCLPSSLHFMKQVIGSLNSMYVEAGVPLKTVHVGGDEVPEGSWLGSPACKAKAGGTLNATAAAGLRNQFLDAVSALLKSQGAVMANWEEAVTKKDAAGEISAETHFVGAHPLVYAWSSLWGGGTAGTGYKLANAGYDVVMAQASNLYFDMPQEKDPEEPAQNWAGYVDTSDVFGMAPTNFYASAHVDTMGNAIDPCSAFGNKVQLTDAGLGHLKGIQGSLWSEHILGPAMMEYMYFPRVLALAERAWAAQPGWESACDGLSTAAYTQEWNDFANRVGQRELPRLAYLDGGYNYRIPLPGAVIEQGMLKANVNFPGLTIRYTTDGSEPDGKATRYDGPVAVKGVVKLRAFDVSGRGSRTSTLQVGGK
jgi:hexosaminidase